MPESWKRRLPPAVGLALFLCGLAIRLLMARNNTASTLLFGFAAAWLLLWALTRESVLLRFPAIADIVPWSVLSHQLHGQAKAAFDELAEHIQLYYVMADRSSFERPHPQLTLCFHGVNASPYRVRLVARGHMAWNGTPYPHDVESACEPESIAYNARFAFTLSQRISPEDRDAIRASISRGGRHLTFQLRHVMVDVRTENRGVPARTARLHLPNVQVDTEGRWQVGPNPFLWIDR